MAASWCMCWKIGISLSLMGREVACPVIISSSLGHMSTEKVLLLAANLSMNMT